MGTTAWLACLNLDFSNCLTTAWHLLEMSTCIPSCPPRMRKIEVSFSLTFYFTTYPLQTNTTQAPAATVMAHENLRLDEISSNKGDVLIEAVPAGRSRYDIDNAELTRLGKKPVLRVCWFRLQGLGIG